MEATGRIVKYALDKDGRISKISTVVQSKITSNDTDKLVFAPNAVIFEKSVDDEYPIASIDRLEDKLTDDDDYAVYNSAGEIVVLLTNNVKESGDTTYAYITKVNSARKDGENVQFVVAFMNGEEVQYYTDDENVVDTNFVDEVVELGLDGEIIVEANEIPDVRIIETTTASAVYARTGRIVLANGDGYYLSEDATIVTVEADDDVVLSDLYDIYEEETEFTVFLNGAKDEILFIVIYE